MSCRRRRPAGIASNVEKGHYEIADLAARYAGATVLTLDRRHFRAVRPLGCEPAFSLLPDDLPQP